jgi:hypothetical protein
MAPKTAEHKQAVNKEASKAAAVLQLPELTALGATNGRHSSADKDDSGFDQDAADPLQAALGMLVNDEDDADDLQEFENLVNHAPKNSRDSCGSAGLARRAWKMPGCMQPANRTWHTCLHWL